ncbi:MAG TPA: threonine-phosphate decarboxylase CobD, partial [Geobacteraceae bacterium]
LGPAPRVRDALSGLFESIVHYPESDCTELREALARLHGLQPAHLCVANGSTQLIYLLPRLVPGKRALVVAPAFSEYTGALSRDGWEVDQFVLESGDGFAIPLDRLEKRLRNGYDFLILGNPGNPSGRLYPLSEVREFIRICQAARCFLLLDEAFMDFCEVESAKRCAVEIEEMLILRSLTKFYALPGMRLGYAIGHASTVARLAALREPWSVNTLAQVAGLASLADAEYAAATHKLIDGERERLTTGLAAIAGLKPYPSAANYLLVEIEDGVSAIDLAERLLNVHILIRSCDNFAGLGDRFFRVAVRKREENDRLLAALAAALADIRPPVRLRSPAGCVT